MAKDIVSYELTGLKELIDALDSLTDKELFNLIRSGVRKGLQEHIVKPVRSAIPNVRLRKSVGIVAGKGKEELVMWGGIIIAKRKDASRPPDGVLLRWTEFGTKNRKTKKGFNRGAVIGKSVVVPRIVGQADKLVSYLNQDFGTAAEQFLAKKLKKINK